jgi:hypothetical protein
MREAGVDPALIFCSQPVAWSKKLGVSEEALKAAVAAAGTSASGSERHIRGITDVNNILRQWNELHESFVPERFEGQTLTYVSSCQAVLADCGVSITKSRKLECYCWLVIGPGAACPPGWSKIMICALSVGATMF